MVVSLLVACTGSPPTADPPTPIPAPPLPDPGTASASFVLRFDDAAAHRIQIEATAHCDDRAFREWWMPVWTPGSYLVREFSRNIEQIEGLGPAGSVSAVKIAKNRWRVPCTPGEPSGVRYTLYARSLSVRESFVDAELGVLNAAATLLLPDAPPDRPLDVRFELPEGWSRIETALPAHPSGDPGRFLAPDVDTLLDAPVLLGNPDVRTFEVAGVRHHLVTLGELGPWDPLKAAGDVEKLTQTITGFWGELPYPEYRFLNVLAERGGGLEHLDSTLMMTSRWSTRRERDYQRWLGLVSHEFFHTWNVKRLRPRGLGPFDYEHEVYTPSLWIAEGLTSYYDDLLLARAGLLTERQWLDRMQANIGTVQRAPGRLVQSLSDASFDAWIKHYRADENSVNSQISYYTKGAVVGWLLDAEIRRATSDRRSLDDVLRAAFRRTRAEGYTPEQFREIASEVAGTDLSDFFARTVDGTGELDYGGALQWWGLRWVPPEAPKGPDPVPGTLGADTSDRLVVTRVLRGTPAWEAGLNVDDEILAIDGHRLTAGNLSDRLAQLGAGHRGRLTVSRRGVLRDLTITLGSADARTWRLEPDPGASPIAARRRRAFLGQ